LQLPQPVAASIRDRSAIEEAGAVQACHERFPVETEAGAEVDAGRTLMLEAHGSEPSRIPPEKLEQLIPESPRVKRTLNQTESHRDRHKLIRIACSIAALENRESPTESHFQEARTYRLQDRWA
jgi:hypothetical protein